MTVAFAHRAELMSSGLSRREIERAVTDGSLIRARRDHYVPGDTPEAIVRAVRVGGRLTCLSLLASLGVFVLMNRVLHVHITRGSSRMRSPHDRFRRLEHRAQRGVRLHWAPLGDHPGRAAVVSILDALAHSVLCQTPRAAVASLDSALHLGLIALGDLPEVFRRLPQRYAVLMPLVDGRCESGSESFLRLMLRGLGCQVEPQVVVRGVGRVDFVIDGWLVIECDSRAHHSDWAAQMRDRRRDALLAALGYTPLRVTASHIFDEPELVLAAIRGLLAAHD
jgi:very-short-patch-repair endonuclease